MKTFVWIAIWCVISTGLPVSAQQSTDNKAPINKSQAAQNAQKQVKGRVLKVDQTPENYRVKMLKKSGRVVSVDVNKQSGQVKKAKQEDER